MKDRDPLPIIALAVVMLGAVLLSSCQPTQPEAQERDSPVTNVASERPPFLVPEPALDREALLLAVVRAASAHASAKEDIESQRVLDGKRFDLRIRFGCSPDQMMEGALGWHLDEERRTVRLHARPEITLQDPLVGTIGDATFEAVEGFWLHRPWMLTAACPALNAPPAIQQQPAQQKRGSEQQSVGAPPDPLVGIAQFYGEDDSRTQRRLQRPYEAREVLAKGESPSAMGYDLILSGRLRRLPDGRVIACASRGTLEPPACIISAEFGRVRLERPDTKEVLAQWGDG
jgi:hypothetical protein